MQKCNAYPSMLPNTKAMAFLKSVEFYKNNTDHDWPNAKVE